jgi:hypothetical protein
MRIIITTIFLAFMTTAYGQDLIVRTNGDTIKGYISLIDKGEIKYRRSDDRSQPIYTIKQDLVSKVVYETGEVDNFEVAPGEKKKLVYDFRHRVQWVYTDVFIARFSMGYEYLNKSGYLGLRVPLSVGLSPGSLYDVPGLTAVTGLDLNIYPTTARGAVKYFFGPQIRGGYSASDIFEGEENTFVSLTFGNGISANVIPELNISAYVGVGAKVTRYPNYFNYYNPQVGPVEGSYTAVYPHMVFGMTVGYNFGR